MENRKRTIILNGTVIIVLFILIIGATYAYFQTAGNSSSQSDINVTTYTSDLLTFEIGNDIVINADQTSFAEGKGNATGSTFAKATLVANNKTNEATKNYYMYLNISKNTFTYTQNETTPELLLTIKDASGNEVKSISNLTYKTVTDGKGNSVSGYDITTKNELIMILNNREITATPTKIEEWNITITLVNFNSNQTANAGKSFVAKLMVQQEEQKTRLIDYVKAQYTGIQGENNIYYHTKDLENGAGDNSYRYAGASNDVCNFNGNNVYGAYSNQTFGASNPVDCEKVYNISSDSFSMYSDNSITRLLSDEKKVIWTGSSCQTTDGEMVNIAFNNGNFEEITEDTCKENSYLMTTDDLTARVANLNMTFLGYGKWLGVRNYICFGSNAETCPTDNLYRIIGVIDGYVKIIKYEYATNSLLGTGGDYASLRTPDDYYKGERTSIFTFYWNCNATRTNTWSTGYLNKTNLNRNFINKLGAKWADKIATTIWKVGGNTYANITKSVPSTTYQNEIISPDPTNSTDNATEYSTKIGLMYVSDYEFAADPSAWTLVGQILDFIKKDYRDVTSINWMYMGYNDWTLSRNSNDTNSSFYVDKEGYIEYKTVDSEAGVRPVFNLTSSVAYLSGLGTMSDPIRIEV